MSHLIRFFAFENLEKKYNSIKIRANRISRINQQKQEQKKEKIQDKAKLDKSSLNKLTHPLFVFFSRKCKHQISPRDSMQILPFATPLTFQAVDGMGLLIKPQVRVLLVYLPAQFRHLPTFLTHFSNVLNHQTRRAQARTTTLRNPLMSKKSMVCIFLIHYDETY